MRYLMILIMAFTLMHADIKVVATPTCEIERVTQSDIKRLFMLKQQSLDDRSIKIVDRDEKSLYKRFVEEHLNKTLRQMKTYWVRMLFTGKKIAPKKLSLEELNGLEYQEECYFSYTDEEESIDPQYWQEVQVE